MLFSLTDFLLDKMPAGVAAALAVSVVVVGLVAFAR